MNLMFRIYLGSKDKLECDSCRKSISPEEGKVAVAYIIFRVGSRAVDISCKDCLEPQTIMISDE